MSGRNRARDYLRFGAKTAFAFADLFTQGFPGPRILIYHQIGPEPELQMSVDPDTFRRQLDWIRSDGDIVPFETALRSAGSSHDRRQYVLTFDDGYSGVYDHAYPLLEEAGIPFTLYVTSGLVEGDHRRAEPGLASLTWDSVRDMLASGLMTVGAHTHTHPDLRGRSEGEVEEELQVSDEMITTQTGVRPRHFAYPQGYWSATAEPVVRRRYETAVLGGGEPVTARTDPFRVCRVPIQRADGLYFLKRKATRGMRMEEWARSRLKDYANPGSEIRESQQ